MFETSIVQARVVAQRRFGLLTVSLVVHTLAIAAIVTATFASLSFPTRAPKELAVFNPVRPLPLPRPLGNPTTARPAPVQPHAQATPRPDVAPPQIPDAVPSLPSGGGASSAISGSGSAVDGSGDPDGVPGGVDIGQPALPGAIVPDVTYRPGRDVQPAKVLHRVDPQYPRLALATRMAGLVVIECVIDRDGNVRDARILKSTFSAFDQPALDALKQWRFAPGMFRGRAVDTYFELTIVFDVR